MTGAPVLHTPRLTLRPISAEHTEGLVALFADPVLSVYHNVNLVDPEQTRAWVARKVGYSGPAGTGEWVYELAGETVGIGRLKPSNELPGGVLEVSFYLARQLWGAGLATEATMAILRHAFTTVAAPVVFALIHEHNERSLAMAARLGFLRVGSDVHYRAVHHVHVALPPVAGLHHVELWVPDLAASCLSWGWLLTELGWTEYQRWRNGVSWRLGRTYLVFEDSPDRVGARHDRCAPGLNHVALHAGPPDEIERLVAAGAGHGWRLMYPDRHPHAGGPGHYAAYLENGDGYEVELVAGPITPPAHSAGPAT